MKRNGQKKSTIGRLLGYIGQGYRLQFFFVLVCILLSNLVYLAK